MTKKTQETFFELLRAGLWGGKRSVSGSTFNFVDSCHNSANRASTMALAAPRVQASGDVDWRLLKDVADKQGLSAIVLDGLDKLNSNDTNLTNMPQMLRLEWIGEVLQGEAANATQKKIAEEMAALFHENCIKTFVLKGYVISECYPKPNHRFSVDMDCFLSNDNVNLNLNDDGNKWSSHNEAWKLGNELIKAKGYKVGEGFYKNSTFHLPGLMVENHQFMVPWRGNKKLKNLEILLQEMMIMANVSESVEDLRIGKSHLFRPPVMVSALFMIEHAYSHFLSEGLTWRMVLDWTLFSENHKEEILWKDFDKHIEKFGFKKFYDSYNRLGLYLIGEIQESNLRFQDRKMLEDIWAPLDLHESLHGVKAKFQLAGNTWRARWKYRLFTDINWMQALWIQVKGFFFMRHPKLKV